MVSKHEARTLRTVFAYPGNMPHAQQTARMLLEADALVAFVTTFAHRRDGMLKRILATLPGHSPEAIARQLERRAIDQVPHSYVHQFPCWEILRTLAQKSGASPRLVDMIWDYSSRKFDELVSSVYVPQSEAVQGFEYTTLASFRRAKELGVARILHVPSLDNNQFRAIQLRERENWPELQSPYDAYFDRKFAERQERRAEEIALADVIIANSSLTARSHIRGGADPSKIYVAQLGCPPALEDDAIEPRKPSGPLRVMSAGPFSLRKGAHYLLQAWQRLDSGGAATLDVYGRQELPSRLLAASTEGIAFHGSVPQAALFDAYKTADVLVFPTLSDGYGMVVAEAMAHGLPVITTTEAGSADLVTPQNGLLVPAADPAALTDALRWCLDNRQQLAEMRYHAVAAARRRQWSDFRHDLLEAVNAGLTHAGYRPRHRRPLPPASDATL